MTMIIPTDDENNGEGERLRDEALNLLRTHRARLIRELTRAAVLIALERGTVCADDVRDRVPIPSEINPVIVGAAMRDVADAGIITRAGYRKTCRAIAHARPLTVWQLVDREAAVAWLRDHPSIEPV